MQISITQCNSNKTTVNPTKKLFAIVILAPGKEYRESRLTMVHALKFTSYGNDLLHTLSSAFFFPCTQAKCVWLPLCFAVACSWINHHWLIIFGQQFQTAMPMWDVKKDPDGFHNSLVPPKDLPAVQWGFQWRSLSLFCITNGALNQLSCTEMQANEMQSNELTLWFLTLCSSS